MRGGFINLAQGVLLAVLVGHVLVIARGVVLPIDASLIVAYVVLGLTELIGRLPGIGGAIPEPLRHGLSIVVIGAVLFGLVSMIVGNIGRIVAAAPQYQDRFLAIVQAGAERIGVETAPTWATQRADVVGRINLQRLLGAAFASASAIVATFSIVLVYAAFLLVERNALARKIERLSDDPAKVARIRLVIEDVNARIGTYLVTKTLINVLLGSVSYVILRVAGVEFAPFWAILIGLFNYIPYVGSFIGVFFPVALSVVQFGAVGPVLALTVALGAAQMAVGNLVEPWLMSSSLNLSPFVILVSLVVWSAMWGVAGAVLSVPIMAILVIVLSEFAGTRPVAILWSRDGDVGPARA